MSEDNSDSEKKSKRSRFSVTDAFMGGAADDVAEATDVDKVSEHEAKSPAATVTSEAKSPSSTPLVLEVQDVVAASPHKSGYVAALNFLVCFFNMAM